MADSVLSFDRKRLEDLEVSIDRATAEQVEVFDFYGHTMVTAYARYVAQYVRQQLGLPPRDAGQNQPGSQRPKVGP